MSFTVVIPARYQSSRLPGKPLIDIAGKPMLQHVVERARQSSANAVYVATDDQRIVASCNDFGAEARMTSASHSSGTDRVAEVVDGLGLGDDAIIVNVQGDEPMIPPALIDQVAANLDKHPEAGICSLFAPFSETAAPEDPNIVKVVTDANGFALYFSRSLIPYPRDAEAEYSSGLYKHHIGIYAYRVGTLKHFVALPPHELELSEKLEQLRALANGIKIHVALCDESVPPGVDTEADLQKIRVQLSSRA